MSFFRSRGSRIFTSQHSQQHSGHTYFDFSKTRLRISSSQQEKKTAMSFFRSRGSRIFTSQHSQQEKKTDMSFFRSRGLRIFTSQHSQQHSAHIYFDFSKTRLRISPVHLSTIRKLTMVFFYYEDYKSL